MAMIIRLMARLSGRKMLKKPATWRPRCPPAPRHSPTTQVERPRAASLLTLRRRHGLSQRSAVLHHRAPDGPRVACRCCSSRHRVTDANRAQEIEAHLAEAERVTCPQPVMYLFSYLSARFCANVSVLLNLFSIPWSTSYTLSSMNLYKMCVYICVLITWKSICTREVRWSGFK